MRSNWSHKQQGEHLHICDLGGEGRMSVTNDIENVLNELRTRYGYDLKQLKISYTDSEGAVDRVMLDAVGNFSHFAPGIGSAPDFEKELAEVRANPHGFASVCTTYRHDYPIADGPTRVRIETAVKGIYTHHIEPLLARIAELEGKA